jgi:large subunit ribosomal protein L22
MDIRASVRYLPISAQKLRLVCDQVRGRDVEEALTILSFMSQKGSDLVLTLVKSAVSNAEENFELNSQDLFIADLQANEGPSQRRVKAGARGRYKPRIKRTAHLQLMLREYGFEEAEDGA